MAITKQHFWNNFGDKRFTKSDLWKVFGYSSYPVPDMDYINNLIESRDYLEFSPGVRGGQGWRLKDNAIAECIKQIDTEKRIKDKYELLIQSTKVAYGQLRYLEYEKAIVWKFELPFKFTTWEDYGCVKQEYGTLTFKIDVRKKSFKKASMILKDYTEFSEQQVIKCIQTEKSFLIKQQAIFEDWLSTLNLKRIDYEN